ncbi:hypothetical protein Tsubulata_033681 [Turnera subulata]|uniref:Uncharacterized protein n=1 Tax=Turnera subulata TaxID=218843 RepID=A0A9Q0GC80_9ROSI|nr:hypothetical protein Tsubulata_033681 [Turnera subulata]
MWLATAFIEGVLHHCPSTGCCTFVMSNEAAIEAADLPFLFPINNTKEKLASPVGGGILDKILPPRLAPRALSRLLLLRCRIWVRNLRGSG